MIHTRGFVPRFLHFWRTRLSAHGGTRLGVAVSGGRDSCVLAALIGRLKRHLGIRKLVFLHLDHGLRPPAERKKDLAVLRRLARKFSAPLVVARARVSSTGGGLEAAGRDARLEFFKRAVRRHKLDSVALAHHLDDRIETFFLFLLRGSGSRGLSSLRETETIGGLRVIRPLLAFTREEIRQFAAAEKIDFHEDITNADPRFLRNRIRMDFIAPLKNWHPGFQKAMSATIETLEAEDTALSDLAEYALKSSRVPPGGKKPCAGRMSLDRSELRMWPPAVLARVLRLADRALGGSGLLGGHENLAAAVRLILGGSIGFLNLPAGSQLRVSNDRVLLQSRRRVVDSPAEVA